MTPEITQICLPHLHLHEILVAFTASERCLHQYPTTINVPGPRARAPTTVEQCQCRGTATEYADQADFAASLRIVDEVRFSRFYCALFFSKSLIPPLQLLSIIFVNNSRLHSAPRHPFLCFPSRSCVSRSSPRHYPFSIYGLHGMAQELLPIDKFQACLQHGHTSDIYPAALPFHPLWHELYASVILIAVAMGHSRSLAGPLTFSVSMAPTQSDQRLSQDRIFAVWCGKRTAHSHCLTGYQLYGVFSCVLP